MVKLKAKTKACQNSVELSSAATVITIATNFPKKKPLNLRLSCNTLSLDFSNKKIQKLLSGGTFILHSRVNTIFVNWFLSFLSSQFSRRINSKPLTLNWMQISEGKQINSPQYDPFLAHLWGGKNLSCRLSAFQSGSLMNELKSQAGVTLILKYFWRIFVPGEAKFHTNTKTSFLHIWSKSTTTTWNIFELFCGWINFFYYKNPGDTF